MAELPFVSIITLSKNCLADLVATRESVVPLLSSEIEHIIVDGASEDGTLDYLDALEDQAFTTTLSEQDGGISDAFNKGVALARGEWIAFINAGDTLIDSGWRCAVAQLVHNGPSINIQASFACYGDSTIPKRTHYNFEPAFTKSLISHQATLVRRSLFEKYGCFDLSLKIRMDYDFWVRVLRTEKFRFLNCDLVQYKLGGISSRMAERFIQEEKSIHRKYFGRWAWIANLRPNIKLLLKSYKDADVV